MPLLRLPEPFDHPDWLFEVKHDGFRALAHIDGHHCDLVSRNGHTFKHWPQLCEELAHAVRPHGAVIDGEIVCLHARGRSNFKNLVVRARVAVFLAVPIAAERSRFCPGYTAVGSRSGSTCHTAVHSRQRQTTTDFLTIVFTSADPQM